MVVVVVAAVWVGRLLAATFRCCRPLRKRQQKQQRLRHLRRRAAGCVVRRKKQTRTGNLGIHNRSG